MMDIIVTILVVAPLSAVIAGFYVKLVLEKKYEEKERVRKAEEDKKSELYNSIDKKMNFWKTSFSNLLDSMPVSANVFSLDGKRYFVNKYFDKVFCAGREYYDKKENSLWNSPVLSDSMKERIRKEDSFITQIEIDYSNPEIRKYFGNDKSEAGYLAFSSHKFDVPGYGQPFIIILCYDITELEKARQKEKRLIRLAQKIHALNTIKIWRYYVETGVVEYFNEGGVLSQCDASDYFPVFEPQDVVLLMDSIDKIIAGKYSERLITMRIADESVQGGYAYWSTKIEGIYKKGKVVVIEGICSQITYQCILQSLKFNDFREEASGIGIITKFVYDVKTGLLDLQGRKQSVSFDAYLKNVHPDDLKANAKVIADVRLGKSIYTSIDYRYKVGGEWQNVQLFITPIKTGENGRVETFSGAVTENRKWDSLISSVVEGDRMLKAVINTVPCMLAIKDPDDDFRYIMTNRLYCEALNVSLELIKRRNDFEVFGETPVTLEGRKGDEKCVRDGKASFELDFEHNGQKYAVNINKTLYVNSSGQRFIICCGVNMSEYKSMIKRLEIAKSIAEKSDKLKTVFLNNVSHEIRTPMNYIKGFAALIADRYGEPDFNPSEMYKQIEIGCGELTRLIDNLVDGAKMLTGFVELTYRRFDLSILFEEVYIEFYREHDARSVRMILEKPYPHCIVNSDRVYVKRIMTVWVSNALKFTKRGYVKFGFKSQDNGVLLFCEDTGCGISDEAKTRLFQPYEKFDAFARGCGFGLPLCKAVVESAGGRMGFESEVNKGSRFWAWLPTDTDIYTIPPVTYDTPSRREESSAEDKKFKILIGESDMNGYSLLEAVLEDFCELNRAFDAQDLVSKAKSGGYALIFVCVELPGGGGFEAVKRLRDSGNSTPVIAITDAEYHYDRAKAVEAGCNDAVSRPINAVKLKTVLEKYGIELQ
jgi:signal transduction histidine kinase/CheY-like chemotaxis protein